MVPSLSAADELLPYVFKMSRRDFAFFLPNEEYHWFCYASKYGVNADWTEQRVDTLRQRMMMVRRVQGSVAYHFRNSVYTFDTWDHVNDLFGTIPHTLTGSSMDSPPSLLPIHATDQSWNWKTHYEADYSSYVRASVKELIHAHMVRTRW